MNYAQVQAYEARKREELETARNLSANKNKQASSKASDVGKGVQQALSAASLLKYIDPFMDWIFGIALSFAFLKDILDFTGWDFIGLGQIFNFSCTVIIFISLYLTGGSGKKKDLARSIMKRYGSVVIGFLVELIPGISFIPTETCVVGLVFYFTLQERREMKEKQKELVAQESYT